MRNLRNKIKMCNSSCCILVHVLANFISSKSKNIEGLFKNIQKDMLNFSLSSNLHGLANPNQALPQNNVSVFHTLHPCLNSKTIVTLRQLMENEVQ